jgi:putative ABC transport system substrate-binding protein
MRRREFITLLGGAATWPIAARAQQAVVPVIGFLHSGSPLEDARLVAAFRNGLGDSGFVEGRNAMIEYRWAEGQFDRFSEFVADLIGRNVTVIFAGSATAAPRAAMLATSTIPIVFYIGGDPINVGLVTSLSRPDGNVTGVTNFGHAMITKRLELLRELLPKSTKLAMLVNPNNANTAADLKDMQAAAAALGLRLSVRNAASNAEIDGAFGSVAQEGADVLFVGNDAYFSSRREWIVGLAAKHAVPAIYGSRAFVEAGGLMSYGGSQVEGYRQAGVYAGRILSGTKPADLPVVLPTKYEFVINLKTAKALGLDFPMKLHAFADDVIE